MPNRTPRILSLFALMPLLACADDDPTPDAEHEDPAEHACERTAEAGRKLMAGTARDDSAPRIELGDEPVTVELASSDEPSYVRVEVDEDTPALLFTSAENVLTGLFHEDDEEEIDAAGANEFCEDDIPEHFDLDLHEPGTYYLQLGPSALDEVWILLTAAEGHAH
jgi:hypothetical protein